MRRAALALPLLLAACGTLPQPFYGNPGPAGAKLAIPPAPVLMVPAPKAALLDGKSATAYAGDLSTALVNYDVPAVSGAGGKQSWRLGISAKQSGDIVTPRYVITGPDGKEYGHQDGAPVPAQAWTSGDTQTLNNAAAADAAPLSKLLAAINAQIQQSNPESLENRPPRIFVGTVSGAPGDGNTALPLNLKRNLPGANDMLANDAKSADFTVTCTVKTKPDTGGQLQVELDWVVRDGNGRIAGQVTQIHDLNPADITPYWGDVAAAAAQEAAGGIQQVVSNAVLKKGQKPTS
ncbi:MAG: hypothetical protein P4L52_06795 [Acidocella sp.]|nr:hypothetical protein [Acidocella sp.]